MRALKPASLLINIGLFSTPSSLCNFDASITNARLSSTQQMSLTSRAFAHGGFVLASVSRDSKLQSSITRLQGGKNRLSSRAFSQTQWTSSSSSWDQLLTAEQAGRCDKTSP